MLSRLLRMMAKRSRMAASVVPGGRRTTARNHPGANAEHRFDLSFHGLRHTAVILMLVSGVDVKTAASRLGHHPRVLLETYSHYLGSANVMAAERLGEMLHSSA